MKIQNKIPNIDGTHKSKDGSVIIVVTRKDITFTFKQNPDNVFIIEDEQSGPKSGGSDKLENATAAMNKTIKFLGF
jgi:hypothetical protein